MKKKVILQISSFAGILLIGILTMTLLGSTEKHSNKNEAPKEVRTVEIAPLDFKDIQLKIEANGVIESQRTLDIVSEASGKIVYAKNNLKSGTFVSKGEMILEIDNREIRNSLISMKSDFLNSVAGLLPELKIEDQAIYTKWKNYFTSLDVEKDIPALPETANTQEQIKVSTRNIFTKYYSVKNQEILLSKHKIVAPFDGYIKSAGLIENSFVSTNQMLFTLIDLNNLEIAVPLLISEYDEINFRNNPSVKIYTGDNSENHLPGIINRTNANLDRNSQSIDAYVTFSNSNKSPGFLPGNYVRVVIEGKTMKNVAMIPRHTIDNESRVFVMEDGKLNSKEVKIAALQNDMAVIENTIDKNTQIVTTILQKPLIGMAIQTAEDVALKADTIIDSEKSVAEIDN